MVATALPFETIPDEPLRAHFTRWLARSLTEPQQRAHTPESAAEQAVQSKSFTDDRASPITRADRSSPGQAAPSDGHRLPANSITDRESLSPIAESGPIGSGATIAAPLKAETRPTPPTRRKRTTRPATASPPAVTPPTPTPAPAAHAFAIEWQGSKAPGRPQFVSSRDGTVWVTKPILRSRGWTDAAVRDFLPEPEGLKPNPRFAVTGAPMPVWRPATVAAAEADPEWKAWLERSLQRRGTTLETLAETDDEDFRARLETARAAIEAEGARISTDAE
jgi:hypothetical protein